MEKIIEKAKKLRHEFYPHGKEVAEEIYESIQNTFDGNMQSIPSGIHYYWKQVIKELEK